MNAQWATWRIGPLVLRRFALFLSMLMSGGILLIPRIPVLLLLIVACLAATDFRLPARRRFWPLYALLLLVLLVALIHPGGVDVGSLATRYANFAAALLLLNMYACARPGALLEDLQAVLWPLVIQAIATVVLAQTMGFLFVPLDFSRTEYRTLLLLFTYHITVDIPGSLVRPDGFFYEPGVFQIYLNLYLYLALFVSRNLRRAVAAALAVLVTQSTTGMVICILLVSAAFLKFGRSAAARNPVVVVLAVFVVAPALMYLGYDNIQDKLYGDFQGSSWAREYDLFTGLNILIEHPLLGIGFDVDRYISAAQVLGYEGSLLDPEGLEERTTSNGMLQLFVSLGLPLGLAFLGGVARQRIFPNHLVILAWFVLSMFGEALAFTPFFLLITFSGYVARRRLAAAATRPLANIAAGPR